MTSDALAYVSGDRVGGFDSVPISSKTVNAGEKAFDTGDLVISAYTGGPGVLALLIEYGGKTAFLSDCKASAVEMADWPESDVYVGCVGRADHVSTRQVDFPPQQRIRVN